MTSLKTVEFRGAFTDLASLPRAMVPEIAFLGRSNVGKSTFVNRLTGRKSLARVSSTPGCTKTLTLFDALLEPKKRLTLVDVPGFGYAKLSRTKREELGPLIRDYLQRRDQLRIVCILNDIRRLPEEQELRVRDLAFEAGRTVVVILTKVDRLIRSELEKQRQAVAAGYGLSPDDVLLAAKPLDTAKIWGRFLAFLDAPRQEAAGTE